MKSPQLLQLWLRGRAEGQCPQLRAVNSRWKTAKTHAAINRCTHKMNPKGARTKRQAIGKEICGPEMAPSLKQSRGFIRLLQIKRRQTETWPVPPTPRLQRLNETVGQRDVQPRPLERKAKSDAERDALHKRAVRGANGGEIQMLLLQRRGGMNNARWRVSGNGSARSVPGKQIQVDVCGFYLPAAFTLDVNNIRASVI